MPCEAIDLGALGTGIACRSTRRRLCRWCNRTAERLCDAPVTTARGRRRDCNAPMCLVHATRVGPDHDLCPDHRAVELPVQGALAVS